MDKSLLTQARLTEEDVELPGVGTIRVRALSRAEALKVAGKEMPVAEMEQRLLSMAMVDPPMTEQDIAEWQAAAPGGELEPIVDVVQRLSGLQKGAAKSGLPGDGGEPGD